VAFDVHIKYEAFADLDLITGFIKSEASIADPENEADKIT
jgi:hypothetical protein